MIVARELTKMYSNNHKLGFNGIFKKSINLEDPKLAVNNLEFVINDGDFVGFIGPNGAGKSSTIKMLVGVLTPTRGIVQVDGLNPQDSRIEVVKKCGVMFGHRTNLWLDLPVKDSFDLMKSLFRLTEKAYKEQLDFLNQFLDLESLLDKNARTLSLGQRVKCDLALSLIHKPKYLILDEPTIGLDILVKLQVRKMLVELNNVHNTTILLASHDLADIETLCQQVLIIDKGNLTYNGSIVPLINSAKQKKTITIETSSNVSCCLIDELKLLGKVEFSRTQIIIEAENDNLNKIVHLLQTNQVSEFNVSNPKLESVIYSLYNNK